MDKKNSMDRSSSEVVDSARIDDDSGLNGSNPQRADDSLLHEPQFSTHASDISSIVDSVLHSDIGISTLLTRLKQSVASAREFSSFLKKRSVLEEEHAQGLRKLCRASHEFAKRPDNRQGSYVQNYDEVIRIHDRMADNGVQFALMLHQMHEDLHDLAANMERGRKQWKQTGLSAEKRVQDSESMMEKAKAKYDSLAEDYDRARTGDKQSTRVFGLKGPKSAAQHEEDLHRKVQAADLDYSSKVQTAQHQRHELVNSTRPQAIKAIQDLINECDSGLTLQLQKFASFNERLLLSNGLCVSPLKGQGDAQGSKSLRDVVYQIDNGKDLNDFLCTFAAKVGAKPIDITYERHPSLASAQQALPSGASRNPPAQVAQTSFPTIPQAETQPSGATSSHFPTYHSGANQSIGTSASVDQNHFASTQYQNSQPLNNNSVPHLPHAPASSTIYSHSSTPTSATANDSPSTDLPPLRPVFGVSLDDLSQRDGSAIPLVIYQCLQAVDLFGLDIEGIYRLSGSAVHVAKLRMMFDHDASLVDFRNPENFFHDVNSVAGLLKQFFRELPDPLLTREHYQAFIDAARIDDDTTRRDSLHAAVNSLPDPNYATLRALTLVCVKHLNRVQEHFQINRMNAGNLAICFGPTLMGSNTSPNIADAGWQVRVIDTILQNTYQIFDDD